MDPINLIGIVVGLGYAIYQGSERTKLLQKSIDLKMGGLLLVCSDRLSDMLRDEYIVAILKNYKNNLNKKNLE